VHRAPCSTRRTRSARGPRALTPAPLSPRRRRSALSYFTVPSAGPDDVYVTEAGAYGLAANPVTKDWNALPPNYWTVSDMTFLGADTEGVDPEEDAIYLACFLVPAFAKYNALIPVSDGVSVLLLNALFNRTSKLLE
jgi:hypothetical protein